VLSQIARRERTRQARARTTRAGLDTLRTADAIHRATWLPAGLYEVFEHGRCRYVMRQ